MRQNSWLKIGGGNVYLRTFGKGKPLLIVHGWGQGGERWIKTAELLARREYQVVLPDLPGFGQSPPPASPWGIKEYVRLLTGLIEKLDLNTVVVVAHSFGGQLAVALAADQPKQVNRLVLIAPALLRPRSIRVYVLQKLARWLKPLFRTMFGKRLFNRMRRLLYRGLKSDDYLQARGVMKKVFTNIISSDVSAQLAKLPGPILLVWGDKDRQVSVTRATQMTRLNPGIKLKVFPGAGHDLPFRHRWQLTALIKEWLKK